MSQENPQFNYTGQGWEGKNYNNDITLKDIAKLVRGYVKQSFPKCKFSVTTEYYAGGQSLHVSLMSGPFQAIIKKGSVSRNDGVETFTSMEEQGYEFKPYAQLNQYVFKDGYEHCYHTPGYNNGAVLSREAWDIMKAVNKYINSFNFDDSDGMIDYSHTNFYSHLNIGKWDKPFVQI